MMPWWGFLIFGAVTAVLTAVIVYLVVRRAVGAIDRNALAASEKTRVEEELAAEREKKAKLENIAGELRDRLDANRAWMKLKMEETNAEIDEEYDALARNDHALLNRLAELIGGGAGAPAGPGGEGEVSEEGGAGADGGDPPDAEGADGGAGDAGEAGGGGGDAGEAGGKGREGAG